VTETGVGYRLREIEPLPAVASETS
jgi:hypothetical protein